MGRGKGRRALVVAAFFIAWIAYDTFVPPYQAIDARAAVGAINAYRAHVSPHLQGFVQCRFNPTCSMYGRESIRKYGLLRGGARTVVRIARCGPWTPLGTSDPP